MPRRHRSYRKHRSPFYVRRNPDDLETLEKMVKARELYQQGVGITEISRRLRADRKTINKWIVGIVKLLSYEEARAIVRQQGFSRGRDYHAAKDFQAEHNLPADPEEYYKHRGTWISWYDFLGTEKLPYDQARAIVRQQGFSSGREYHAAKDFQAEHRLPSDPEGYYKSRGTWISWYDFLGTEKLPYDQARAIVRQQGFSGRIAYHAAKAFQAEHNLPGGPETYYTRRGAWKGWPDFLGTKKPTKKLPYEQARAIVRQQGFSGRIAYHAAKAFQAEHNLPGNPEQYYKSRGTWRGWPDFLRGSLDPNIDYQERELEALAMDAAQFLTSHLSLSQVARLLNSYIPEGEGHLYAASVSYWKEGRAPAFKYHLPLIRLADKVASALNEGSDFLIADLKSKRHLRRRNPEPWRNRDQDIKDGRGRISYALGMGIESLPAIIISTTDSFDESDYRDNPDDLETLETIALARKLYQQGHSITAIRKRLKVRWDSVRQWVDDLVEDKSDDLKLRARQLYITTGSIKETAQQLGVSRHKIDPRWISDIRDKQLQDRATTARDVYIQTGSIEQAAHAVGIHYYKAKEWLADLLPQQPEIDPRRERARQLYQEGNSIAAVARLVHAKWDRVKGWVEDLIQEDTRPQRARELYQQLGNYKGVAKQLGVGWRTVRNWVSHRNPDSRLRQLQRIFDQSPTYQNLIPLEIEKQRIHGKDYRYQDPKLTDTDEEITIEGQVWSCQVIYEPAHFGPHNSIERASIAHILVEDDDLELEIDVMPLLSDEEIRALEDKITEREWDQYNDWRDG